LRALNVKDVLLRELNWLLPPEAALGLAASWSVEVDLIRGTVSGFRERYEQPQMADRYRPLIVWGFRLERSDSAGNPLPRAAVEMRGTRFQGSISDGDVVEIDQAYRRGVLVTASTVRNLTSGSTVVATGENLARYGWTIWSGIALLLFLIITAVILGLAATQWHT